MIVAVTSRRFACSSMRVPSCPGRMPSGGSNSTGPSVRPRNGTGSSSPVTFPNAWSVAEPTKRRSRPRHNRNPSPRRPATPTTAPVAIFSGAGSNAVWNVSFSSRIGTGVGTTPVGIATTTVSPEWKPMSSCVNHAVLPSTFAEVHGSDEPWGPAKHATCVMSVGAVTMASPRSIGTSHSVPMAFQKSSSWSSKWLSAPSTV